MTREALLRRYNRLSGNQQVSSARAPHARPCARAQARVDTRTDTHAPSLDTPIGSCLASSLPVTLSQLPPHVPYMF